MITFFITSTTMILVILALRFLFKNQVSFLILYPLWGIVLLRLLIPYTPLESPMSIMNLVNGMVKETEVSWKENEKLKEKNEVFDLKKDLQNKQINYLSIQKEEERNQEKKQEEENSKNIKRNIVFELSINQWAIIFWLCGSVFLFFCIITANLLFYRNLCKNRIRVLENYIKKRKIPVYITDYVQTPCLVGIFYPAIYLPLKVYKNIDDLNMILAHEEMHAHHKDHIWTLFRTLCLIMYWFDPFIWIAAFYSKQDAEIACDEAILQHCTDMQKYDYGRMLIWASSRRKQGNFYFLTSIESGKRNLKERILMLTKRKKRSWKQIVGMFLVIIVLAGCGLTSKAQTKKNDINKENEMTEKEQNKDKEGERDNKTIDNKQQENESYKINKETIIQKFQTFMEAEINERTEWINLKRWKKCKGKPEQLYFSVQDLGIDQIPCLLVAPPFGIIMKNNAMIAMVYYYDWEKETIELLTALQTVGSGYPLEIKDGQLLVTSGQHSIRVYNWGIEGDYSKLKAKEVYGFGTYNETEKRTLYTYSEITWQVPFPIEEGGTVYEKDLDSYADSIDINEDFEETKAKEFDKNFGYTYGAEIPFYHNTEKGWKKYRTSI